MEKNSYHKIVNIAECIEDKVTYSPEASHHSAEEAMTYWDCEQQKLYTDRKWIE